jgi:anti-anti-sigma factor
LLPGDNPCVIVSGVDQGAADEPVFAVSAQQDAGHVRVVVSGEVDMSTAEEMFRAATPEGAVRASLDLRAVTFFDSAAIHAVVRLAQQFPGTLDVLPSRQVGRVLEISGLGDQAWLRSA